MPEPDNEYLRRLGKACYSYAAVEWEVVAAVADHSDYSDYSEEEVEEFSPWFIKWTETSKKGPKGSINPLDSMWEDDEEWQRLAQRFRQLVDKRNALVHSYPMTASPVLRRLLYYKNPADTRNFAISEHWLHNFISESERLHDDLTEFLQIKRLEQIENRELESPSSPA
ncbi:MAG: hypothetical protein OXN95_01490 [bacterium]|nr:hypothetical protein [bacterium]